MASACGRAVLALCVEGDPTRSLKAHHLQTPPLFNQTRKLRAQQEAYLAVQDTKRLKETMLFKMADDGIRGVYMDIKQHDRTSRATNSVYDAMHRSASDMTSDLMQRKTLVALLTASCVHYMCRSVSFPTRGESPRLSAWWVVGGGSLPMASKPAHQGTLGPRSRSTSCTHDRLVAPEDRFIYFRGMIESTWRGRHIHTAPRDRDIHTHTL